jgi:uncharacterized protein (TIGR03067 family)
MLVVQTAWLAAGPEATGEPEGLARLACVRNGFAVEGRGENPDCGPVKLGLTFTDKTIHGTEIRSGNRVDHGEGGFMLDLAADPDHLNAAKTTERGRGQAYVGIYSLEDDTLKRSVSLSTSTWSAR